MPDEYAPDEEVNLEEIVSRLFLIDARLFKHYRLLAWFPTYLKMFIESQCFLMDNNQGGNEELCHEGETDIFPAYVNYYIAIMAVSCYQCDYLLVLLQE